MTKKTRHNLITTACFLGLVIMLSLMPVLSTQAQGPDGPRKPQISPDRPTPVAAGVTTLRPGITTGSMAITDRASGTVNIIIELEAPSGAEAAGPRLRGSQAAIQNQIARVKTTQAAVVSQIRTRGIEFELLGTSSLVLNAIAVRTDASNLDALNALPGVRIAFVERIGTLDNASSVPFIGTPSAWASGYTGAGITIGIIDSGINWQHVNFGNPVTGNAYTTFPTPKIVGGYDYVGNSWTPGANYVPDNDPMDQNGHGSHVAGTAAGYGVTNTGETYGGGYAVPPAFTSLMIGPGVAPEATLYAYKVGSSGDSVSEWATIQALNRAFLDGVDVINLSIGGDYGNPDIGWARAADNAAMAGILIASSAGNSGDSYFVQGDPSTADWVISVASSDDGSLGYIVNTAPTLATPQTFEAGAASFGPVTYSVTANLELAVDADNNDACSALIGFTPGNIALIDRGGCVFTEKVSNAQAAGAVGALIANSSTGTFGSLGGTASAINIPSVMIRYANGVTLKSELLAGAVNVTLDNTIVFGATADTVSTFSSRGPQRSATRATAGLKPDITAPGNSITSSWSGGPTAINTIGGTSMASPHVAGALALLREQHSGWSVAEIKALIMNTATNNLYSGNNQTGDIYGPARVGAGRLSVSNAVSSDVIAYNSANPELVSVSFGLVEVTAAGAMSRTITVENKSAVATYNFDVDYLPSVDIDQYSLVDNVYYTVSPNTISLPPGASADLTVTLHYTDPSLWVMPHTHDPTVAESQDGWPRHWLSEESGKIELTSTSGAPDLWVPVYAGVRPAGTMRAVSNDIVTTDGGATGDPCALLLHHQNVSGQRAEVVCFDLSNEPAGPGNTVIGLNGTGVFTGNTRYDEYGIVSVFELLYESPNESYPGETGPNAAYAPFSDAADIQYVGLTTDFFETASVSSSLISLGIATYGEWSSLAEETWFETFFDVDEDGTPDYIMYNWNNGAASGGDPNDVFLSYVVDAATNATVHTDYVNWFPGASLDTHLFNSNVLFMTLPAAAIGLSDANPDFDFLVIGRQFNAADTNLDVDFTSWLSYNIAEQAISFSGGYTGPAFWDDLPGFSIPVAYIAPDAPQEPTPESVNPTDPEIAWTVPRDPGITSLPATGYPPNQQSTASGTLPLLVAVGALALVVVLGGLVLRRRTRA